MKQNRIMPFLQSKEIRGICLQINTCVDDQMTGWVWWCWRCCCLVHCRCLWWSSCTRSWLRSPPSHWSSHCRDQETGGRERWVRSYDPGHAPPLLPAHPDHGDSDPGVSESSHLQHSCHCSWRLHMVLSYLLRPGKIHP